MKRSLLSVVVSATLLLGAGGNSYVFIGGSISDTVEANGTAATPIAAGTAIATIPAASLPAGTYLIAFQSGADVTAVNQLNMEARRGGIFFMPLPTLTMTWSTPVQLTLTGAQAVSINATLADATAGQTYRAVIISTRIQ